MKGFIDGNWMGTKYIVKPLGWRKFFPKYIIPNYYAPEKIRFMIKITSMEDLCPVTLKRFRIFEIIPGKEIREITEHRGIDAESNSYCFNDVSNTNEGIVNYVIGEPGKEDCHELIEVNVLSRESDRAKKRNNGVVGKAGILLGILFQLIGIIDKFTDFIVEYEFWEILLFGLFMNNIGMSLMLGGFNEKIKRLA